MMPGRAQHPTSDMIQHAHGVVHIMGLKNGIDRTMAEIASLQKYLAALRRELRRAERKEAARVA
jgi:hypothetical protein